MVVVHRTARKLARSIVLNLKKLPKPKNLILTAADLDAAVRTIAGTARSMGIDTEGV